MTPLSYSYSSPHGKMVILTDEHDRQSPKLGEVEGLANLTLVSSAVSVQSKVDSAVLAILVSKGDPGTKRHLVVVRSVLTGLTRNRLSPERFQKDDILPGRPQSRCLRRSSWRTCACCRPYPSRSRSCAR